MGHSTNKVFWISIGAACFGVIVGIAAASAFYYTVGQLKVYGAIADIKKQMEEGAQAGPPPASVRVGDAAVELVQSRFDVVGRLQELQMSTIAAEVEGKVLSVPVEEGDRVKGGETVLAEIDAVWSDLALKSAEADVSANEATLQKSESDLAILEKLLKVNSAKPKEVSDMRAKVKAGKAALKAAIAKRDRAKEQVGRLKIVAPFDGLVVKKMTEEGQWVNPGASVMEVISDGQIDAMVNVPERYINLIEVGGTVDVKIDALNMMLKGEVLSVTPMGSSSSRTFPVKVRLKDESKRLLPGMSVTAALPLGTKAEHVVVPRDAVLYTTKGSVVWVASMAPKAQMPIAMPVYVKVLYGLGDKVVVQPQSEMGPPVLVDGAKVVTMGAERIMFTGQPLMVDGMVPAGAPEAGKAEVAKPASEKPETVKKDGEA